MLIIILKIQGHELYSKHRSCLTPASSELQDAEKEGCNVNLKQTDQVFLSQTTCMADATWMTSDLPVEPFELFSHHAPFKLPYRLLNNVRVAVPLYLCTLQSHNCTFMLLLCWTLCCYIKPLAAVNLSPCRSTHASAAGEDKLFSVSPAALNQFPLIHKLLLTGSKSCIYEEKTQLHNCAASQNLSWKMRVFSSNWSAEAQSPAAHRYKDISSFWTLLHCSSSCSLFCFSAILDFLWLLKKETKQKTKLRCCLWRDHVLTAINKCK